MINGRGHRDGENMCGSVLQIGLQKCGHDRYFNACLSKRMERKATPVVKLLEAHKQHQVSKEIPRKRKMNCVACMKNRQLDEIPEGSVKNFEM